MIYTARCRDCCREEDFHSSVADRDNTPECCNQPMRRILTAPNINPDVDYVTSDITGDPVHITSRRQQRQLCEKHGVTPKLSKPWT